MKSIDEIMYLISWERSENEQTEGINAAEDIQCIKTFFLPMGKNGGKKVWENCAVIISRRHDDELIPYIMDMLFWIADLNWPGAEIILQRLIQMSGVQELKLAIDDIVPILVQQKKRSWLLSIYELVFEGAMTCAIKKDTLLALCENNTIVKNELSGYFGSVQNSK